MSRKIVVPARSKVARPDLGDYARPYNNNKTRSRGGAPNVAETSAQAERDDASPFQNASIHAAPLTKRYGSRKPPPRSRVDAQVGNDYAKVYVNRRTATRRRSPTPNRAAVANDINDADASDDSDDSEVPEPDTVQKVADNTAVGQYDTKVVSAFHDDAEAAPVAQDVTDDLQGKFDSDDVIEASVADKIAENSETEDEITDSDGESNKELNFRRSNDPNASGTDDETEYENQENLPSPPAKLIVIAPVTSCPRTSLKRRSRSIQPPSSSSKSYPSPNTPGSSMTFDTSFASSKQYFKTNNGDKCKMDSCICNQPGPSTRRCPVCHEVKSPSTRKRQLSIKDTKSKKVRVVVCCSEKLNENDLRFGESNRFCEGEHCISNRIPVGSNYWFKPALRENGNEVTSEKMYCIGCYNAKVMHDQLFNRTGFAQYVNKNKAVEKILECVKCKNLWHQCCAYHLTEDEFVCRECDPKPQSTTLDGYTRNQCDSYMEKHLNEFWKRMNRNNKISVVSFRQDVTVLMKDIVPWSYLDNFCQKYRGGTDTVVYEARMIFVFQRIGEVDVCVFAMTTQEYVWLGDLWTVIESMDSVCLVEPDDCRGILNGEVINAYLAFAKAIGYKVAHFKADPPGHHKDDNIFHVHPEGTKYRDPASLKKWFLRVLKKSVDTGVIDPESKLFSEDYQDPSHRTPLGVVPFDGGFWPRCLMNIDRIVMELRLFGDQYKARFEKLLGEQYEINKENDFFIEFKDRRKDPTILDTDEFNPHKFFGDKTKFLMTCWKINWEFSSLRRAAFSSVGMIRVILGELNLDEVVDAVDKLEKERLAELENLRETFFVHNFRSQ